MRLLNSLQLIFWRVVAKNPFRNRFLYSYCSLCGDLCNQDKAISSICIPCSMDLPLIIKPCLICSISMPTDKEAKICGECLKKPPFYHSSTIPLEYSYPNDIFIKELKYNDKLIFSDVLSKILLENIQQTNKALPECIIPVPLHPLRLIKRGYNQSELIAQTVAKQLGISTDYTLCKRIKNTKSQTKSNNIERKNNLRNAFAVNKDIPYKHIAIIDDVVTTGNTVNELAKQLSEAGVETIEVWACARKNNNH